MRRISPFLTWLFIVLIVVFSVLNLILIIKIDEKNRQTSEEISQKVETIIKDRSVKIEEYKETIRGLRESLLAVESRVNGVKKPKDGKDGKDGKNGTDGLNGLNGKNGVNGSDGLTPEVVCNTVKNRWEVRYRRDDAFEALNGEIITCTITKDMIIEILGEL